MMVIRDNVQVIFGPTEDFMYLNGYATETTEVGDFYDEIIRHFTIVSCVEDTEFEYRYNVDLLFGPTGDLFQIKGYFTYAESEADIHVEVRHYLEVNGFHRHRASWDTFEG